MKTWNEFFEIEKTKPFWNSLNEFLNFEYENYKVFPKKELLFNAFNLTPLNKVKVVILGQDPYHEPGQAMGLAFSVPDECKIPPSLVNIFKEIEIETGRPTKRTGNLTYLAEQGVFLLNTILSVRCGEALSHKRKEYNLFIKDVFECLNSQENSIVFMLWGRPAQKFEKYITNSKHHIIKRTHPSPLGANQGGWFNCNQFNECNEFLKSNNTSPIEWNK